MLIVKTMRANGAAGNAETALNVSKPFMQVKILIAALALVFVALVRSGTASADTTGTLNFTASNPAQNYTSDVGVWTGQINWRGGSHQDPQTLAWGFRLSQAVHARVVGLVTCSGDTAGQNVANHYAPHTEAADYIFHALIPGMLTHFTEYKFQLNCSWNEQVKNSEGSLAVIPGGMQMGLILRIGKNK